jgi:hypothetical protein
MRVDHRSQLDYEWWASNGPTAGYLFRLALEIAPTNTALPDESLRAISLHVVGPAKAAACTASVSSVPCASGGEHISVIVGQQEPVAALSIVLSAPRGAGYADDSTFPDIGPPESYRTMTIDRATSPPVLGQFEYRPTTSKQGTSARPGWDLVWLGTQRQRTSGKTLIASMVDCWYPASYMRSVRGYLSGADLTLVDPPPTTLTGAHIAFTAQLQAYTGINYALLAGRVVAANEGHVVDQCEIWSERGQLLAVSSTFSVTETSCAPV